LPKESTKFGKYQLLAQLARGGMAEIFLARHKGRGVGKKLFVIKRILPHLAKEAEFVEMFLDEARIVERLVHPNIVHVFSVEKIQGEYLIAMEYLAGENLWTVLRTCKLKHVRPPVGVTTAIVIQVAEGLQYAHTICDQNGRPMNIVHRDISPQNIFVLYNGNVKIVDFGIAKAAARSTSTQAGTLKGKLAYVSPEQILGGDIDARADVFSLGVVLWESLTGHLFRKEGDKLELIDKIISQEVPSPRRINASIPKQLADITLKATARDREHRYPSAEAMKEELADFTKKHKEDCSPTAIRQFQHGLFQERIAFKEHIFSKVQSLREDTGSNRIADLSEYLLETVETKMDMNPALAKHTVQVDFMPHERFWKRSLILYVLTGFLSFTLAILLVFVFKSSSTSIETQNNIEPTKKENATGSFVNKSAVVIKTQKKAYTIIIYAPY